MVNVYNVSVIPSIISFLDISSDRGWQSAWVCQPKFPPWVIYHRGNHWGKKGNDQSIQRAANVEKETWKTDRRFEKYPQKTQQVGLWATHDFLWVLCWVECVRTNCRLLYEFVYLWNITMNWIFYRTVKFGRKRWTRREELRIFSMFSGWLSKRSWRS